MSKVCSWRDEAGFCIPALWGWPGCHKGNDRRGNPKPCECPPDLETARQYRIKQIRKEGVLDAARSKYTPR